MSTHKFDVICVSETYLNSNTSIVDENLEIVGYTSECINLKISFDGKVCNFISLYRSPSQ